MEPADNLFSSPEKGTGAKQTSNGHVETNSDNEQDMELDEGMRPKWTWTCGTASMLLNCYP
jgi:hypothetical protein